MDTLLIIGYVLAVVIGIVLGMLGGGGAVLAVPVLVYLIGIPTDHATAYSLFIVGVTALLGMIRYVRMKQVNWNVVFLFLIPSLIAVLLTRKYILPAIPEVVFHFFDKPIARKPVVMVTFALLMVAAGVSMLRHMHYDADAKIKSANSRSLVILGWGALIGFLAGLLGAGGGFMIVPVFVLFLGMPMKTAVGTSVSIIAIQSLIGFVGDLGHRTMDWSFLIAFTSFSLAGLVIGTAISHKSKPEKLKRVFGWFVLAIGAAIVTLEIVG